jgi:hypothetical protein
MAMYADLYADQGSYFSTVVNVGSDSATDTNLTGYTARGKIRKAYISSTSYDFVVTIPNAAAGQVMIALDSTTTAAIKPGRYLYDVEIVQTSTSKVTRVVEGQIDFAAGVSTNLFNTQIFTVTASYTLKITDNTVLCNCASNAISITLPAAAAAPNKIFIIKKIDATANVVTIVGTVDGTVNPTIPTQYQTVKVQSNGVNWYNIS